MHLIHRVSRHALFCAAAIILAACSGQKEPAQRLIHDIEWTVTAASAEAAKYVPDQLAEVQARLGAVKASFARKDYAAVLTAAPPVLEAAQGLATAAATQKDAVLKSLNDSWSVLAESIPGAAAAVQSRVEALGKKSGKKMAAGIDLDAARAAQGEASSLWSKAQAAFAAGNLEEAVSTAKNVQAKIEGVAASLKLNLPAGAAASPAPPAK
jgi:hypothetical protein